MPAGPIADVGNGSLIALRVVGGAVAFGTKAELGSLVRKAEVGVLGIVSQPIAAAVRTAVTIANSVIEGSGPSREQHAGGDGRKAATEGR